MECMTLVQYSMLINEAQHDFITPSRGLHEGVSFPHICFWYARKVSRHWSSRLMYRKKFQESGQARMDHQLLICSSLTIVCFFCKENRTEVTNLQNILQHYELVWVQSINYDKSRSFFSPKTREDNRTWVSNVFGVGECKSVEKYLGIPTYIGMKWKEEFLYIKKCVMQATKTWYEKSLSRAGKAVSQAILIYVKGVFHIQEKLCREMEITLRNFLWNHGRCDRGMSWMR